MVTHIKFNTNEYLPQHKLLYKVFSACNQWPGSTNFLENISTEFEINRFLPADYQRLHPELCVKKYLDETYENTLLGIFKSLKSEPKRNTNGRLVRVLTSSAAPFFVSFTFTVKRCAGERLIWSISSCTVVYLKPCQTSITEFYCENSQR